MKDDRRARAIKEGLEMPDINEPRRVGFVHGLPPELLDQPVTGEAKINSEAGSYRQAPADPAAPPEPASDLYTTLARTPARPFEFEGKAPDLLTPPDPLMRFLGDYMNMPGEEWAVGEVFFLAAQRVLQLCPRDPERTVALRKLLEGRDAALRSLRAR